ncbi:hypothetical protein [Lewinella sp. IMCC34183]|uniref:hypothetical protein n=1 Tax=Lewinella sp. IMCC34183 TaxID=2248762 RepID=UPI001300AFC6|nr:hypothetical protein [Lewinella sp. IMCC34183]
MTIRTILLSLLASSASLHGQSGAPIIRSDAVEVSGTVGRDGNVLLAVLERRVVAGLPRGQISVYGASHKDGSWEPIYQTGESSTAEDVEYGDPSLVYNSHDDRFYLFGMKIRRLTGKDGDAVYEPPEFRSDLFVRSAGSAGKDWSPPRLLHEDAGRSFADYPVALLLDKTRILVAYTAITSRDAASASSRIHLSLLNPLDGSLRSTTLPEDLGIAPTKSVSSVVAEGSTVYLTVADPERLHIVAYDLVRESFKLLISYPHSFDWTRNVVITKSVVHGGKVYVAAHQAHTVNSVVSLYRFDLRRGIAAAIRSDIKGSHICLVGAGDRLVITANQKIGSRSKLAVYAQHRGSEKIRLIRRYDTGKWSSTGYTGEYQYLLETEGKLTQYYIRHSHPPGVGQRLIGH